MLKLRIFFCNNHILLYYKIASKTEWKISSLEITLDNQVSGLSNLMKIFDKMTKQMLSSTQV